MTRVNWKKLKTNFWFEHSQTGITAKDWCKKYQLNYATARRYIKPRSIKEGIKFQVDSEPLIKAISPHKRRGPPLGSQNAFKHGGYSNLFYNNSGHRIEAITPEAELMLSRVRIHYVLFYMVQLQQKLEKKPSDEITINLYNDLSLADLVIDKNLARIVAVTKKASSRRFDDLG